VNRRTFIKSILATTAASLTGGSVYAWCSEKLQVSRQKLTLPGIDRKLRIAALSDLHAPCRYLSMAELIDAVNAQRPDVLILAGDMFSNLEDFEATVAGFKAAAAGSVKLATLGNWEYDLRLRRAGLTKCYRDAGINLLVNDICEVGGLKIIGLDDLLYGKPRFALADQALDGGAPAVVISHCPAGFDRLRADFKRQGVVISGHTHGGQIAPFGQALVTPRGSGRYVKGWYQRGGRRMYVMRGVGTCYLPVRIGSRPELLVLDLLPERAGLGRA
jgi:predicted MPP superfamily phosphohydrolase